MIRIVLRVFVPIVFAVLVIIGCVIYLAHDSSINHGETDVLYNDIVYERSRVYYNLRFSEENSKYAGGDYSEIVEYGQERLWEIRVLNDDENVLYATKFLWLKPGYKLPGDFGEEFSSAYYIVSSGYDELVLPDSYVETVNEHLADFKGSVKLEDIVSTVPSDVAEFSKLGSIRFNYKSYADMSLYYDLCKAADKYYLNVKSAEDGTDVLYEIKPEYIELLTSAITDAE